MASHLCFLIFLCLLVYFIIVIIFLFFKRSLSSKEDDLQILPMKIFRSLGRVANAILEEFLEKCRNKKTKKIPLSLPASEICK